MGVAVIKLNFNSCKDLLSQRGELGGKWAREGTEVPKKKNR